MPYACSVRAPLYTLDDHSLLRRLQKSDELDPIDITPGLLASNFVVFQIFPLIGSPTFQTLAPEIIILVLENLSDSATLLAAILSCRHVHNAVKPYIPSVLNSIAISQIISLLWDSYALYKILRSVHPAPRDLRDLRDQARFLTQTLVALEGVAHYCAGDLLPLELPLQQCDIRCTSIALTIADNIVQPCDSAIESWANTLSSYNMTFRVVTVKAQLYVSRLSVMISSSNSLI